MFHFQIQTHSDVSASQQLLDQLLFAIASGQFPPGHRLPSLRQLELITGLHRNTINKVYQQLENLGWVEAIAGSGMYVRTASREGMSPTLAYPEARQAIAEQIDRLVARGLTLYQIKELWLQEMDWRLRCRAQLLVTVPRQDLGAGEWVLWELSQALPLPMQLVPLEDLPTLMQDIPAATVVTTRYFLPQAEAIAQPLGWHVLSLDIYNYAAELAQIRQLPAGSRLGLVSLSPGFLRVAEIMIHSLRGEALAVMTSAAGDRDRLAALLRHCQLVWCDGPSHPLVQKMLGDLRDDLIRIPRIHTSPNYIQETSLALLRRALGFSETEDVPPS